ncbi:hypothetical protein HOI18_02470 [Candidatus Uhrbacteria bacterium]|jgi:hypothetical protein|nr:hypothetical protein [Candidatus Uhrbacteria bacterium]
MSVSTGIPPLTGLIARLLDARGWDNVGWAKYLSCNKTFVEDIRRGVLRPTDEMMSAILCELERTQDSLMSEDTKDALAAFWGHLHFLENPAIGLDKPPHGLTLREGESISERFTRWTNEGWLRNLTSNLYAMPPAQRRAFIEDLPTLFEKHRR